MSDPTVAPSPSGSASQGRPSAWRRTYVVDGRTQFRVAGLLIAGLAILGVIQAVSLYVFFQPPSDGRFDGDQVRALMLEVGMVQFAVTALLALALGVLLSHRFVGAGLVLRRAVQGMAVGDSSQRLTLRAARQGPRRHDARARPRRGSPGRRRSREGPGRAGARTAHARARLARLLRRRGAYELARDGEARGGELGAALPV